MREKAASFSILIRRVSNAHITLTAGGSDRITLVDVLAGSVTTGDIDFV